ncbi:MAG: polysaccharide deacetylase family protein [Hyphomicrobiales bacterium]|nr:polysaccharide deacetylase family protein [Hyphomicrobiales bacterium]
MIPRQHRYPYSIIDRRPDYSWPDGKRLAFWIGTNIEVFAFGAGLGPDPVLPGEPPTQRNFAWRDYGNRVGVWRLFDLLEELKLPTSCIINSLVYEHHPEIPERIRARGDDVIGHGRTNAERQRGLWELDEQRLIEDATATIRRHEGRMPKGWLGAGAAESNVTLDLLQAAGYKYVLDWPCDDQPIWLNTAGGRILNVPYPIELNDIGQVVQRQHNARELADMIVDQFDEMVRQCEAQPLVCVVSLHTYIVGQPFRLGPLRRALEHIVRHPQRERVWFTRADAIADFCYGLPPGTIPGA